MTKYARRFHRVSDLKRGDIVVSRGTGTSYVVEDVAGESALAVRSVRVTNPAEWAVCVGGISPETSVALLRALEALREHCTREAILSRYNWRDVNWAVETAREEIGEK